MTAKQPEFLTTALSLSGAREVAAQDSIRQRMEDTIQKLLRGEVHAAEISPMGDPYARIEVALPFDHQMLKNQPALGNLIRAEAGRIKEAITPILDRHCTGMVLEWVPPFVVDAEQNVPAVGHFILYGDKTIPAIATMDAVSTWLTQKQAVLRQEVNDVFSGRRI